MHNEFYRYPTLLILALPEPQGGGLSPDRRWGRLQMTDGVHRHHLQFNYSSRYDDITNAIGAALHKPSSLIPALLPVALPSKTLTIVLQSPPSKERGTGILLLETEHGCATVYFDYRPSPNMGDLYDPLQTLWKKLYQE